MRTPRLSALLVLTVSLAGQFRTNVRLVEVYASVYDRKGNPVDNLTKERFRVLEEGLPQPILNFEATSDALSLAILIDTTGSMKDALGSVRNAVSNLLEQMRPDDSVAVYRFSTSIEMLQDFTTDKAAARKALMKTRAEGATALFDAVAEMSHIVAARSGKKVIVVFTDGADNASHVVPEAAIGGAGRAGILVYSVAEGDATRDGRLLKQLSSLATGTGGLSYQAKTPRDIARVFADIQAELKHVYLISYKPPAGDDSKWRTISLAINGAPEYRIRGRAGYYPE